MKRPWLGIALLVLALGVFGGVVIGAEPAAAAADVPLDGNGTESDPYVVESLSDLRAVEAGYLETTYYVLTADIDATVGKWDDAVGIEVLPVGPVVVSEPSTDVDSDGLLEDVDGNGRVTVADVTAYLGSRQDLAVQSAAFDFDRDGRPGELTDLIVLFARASPT